MENCICFHQCRRQQRFSDVQEPCVKSGFWRGVRACGKRWQGFCFLFFFLNFFSSDCVTERGRAGEHCQTKRVLSQHQSSFLSRQLGRATSLLLSPFSLGFSLLLTHMLSLPPLSTHMCVLSFLLLTNLGYCMLFFALCISSPFSLSWARSLPTPTYTTSYKNNFGGKKCDTGFGVFLFELVLLCELSKKKWHVLTFMPL